MNKQKKLAGKNLLGFRYSDDLIVFWLGVTMTAGALTALGIIKLVQAVN